MIWITSIEHTVVLLSLLASLEEVSGHLHIGKYMGWSLFPLNNFLSISALITRSLASNRFTPWEEEKKMDALYLDACTTQYISVYSYISAMPSSVPRATGHKGTSWFRLPRSQWGEAASVSERAGSRCDREPESASQLLPCDRKEIFCWRYADG